MKIADIRALPEGAPLRTTRGELVTLVSTGAARAVVRHDDGQTREYSGVSLRHADDPYPLITGLRAGLTGHTVTIERATRTAARPWQRRADDWEALIGRRALVERQDGRLRQVLEIEDWCHIDDVESMAEWAARDHGARYVPVGR